jgi:hypothetical protein
LNALVLKHFAFSLGNFRDRPSTTFVPCIMDQKEKNEQLKEDREDWPIN